MVIMTRVHRTMLASPTCAGHAGMEQPSWPGWDPAPEELDDGFGLELQTLFAVRSCGLWHPPVAVLPPLLYPTGFWDAAATLG